ncbi:class I adenylate-forming enzyme family protein [Williamsia soli]|uniref:class I adenylate-forming enzyme family protein n=1 Tax=Williamsia soli TaxID=364929 RepID=UPI001A9E7011|nr:AMP-binding protein [Williamsia soli]
MHTPTALVFEQQEFTLPQLDRLTAGLAATLRSRGVTRGGRVALMSSNRPEFAIAVRAIWHVGAAVVLLSPAYKRGEIEHAVEVTSVSHAAGDNPILAGLMPMIDLDEPISPVDPTEQDDESTEHDPNADAVLVFSSGTTGMPKAVRHTHASLRAAVRHWRDALKLTSDDRIQIVTPPSHILGLLNLVTAFEVGARVRLHRRFDLDSMLRHIQSDRITLEMVVAPIALAIADHPDLESYDLSSLRYMMWGATPVTPSVAEIITRRTGVAWVPAYGASELPVITCNPVDGGARLDSVGRAVSGVRLRVAGIESGKPLGVGETGEIQARSSSVMAGYLPGEATAAAFADNWYRTGDVGSIDADGWVTLTDRSKEMIKVRGFQVAPAEVEAVLHGHPAVSDCAVFGVPDAMSGEAIVAAVALTSPVEALELADSVGERLAAYKRPHDIVFVSEIPRLPSGKVLRRVLKERYGRTSDQ